MDEKFKLSVVIPVYNLEKHVSRCITSIQNQLLQDIEIIVMDDGSTDRSFEIISKQSQNDIRIKYFKQQNKGVSSARNKGLEIAKGEFITFIDGDDYIDITMLETMYSYAKKNNLNIIFCGLSKSSNLNNSSGLPYTINSYEYIDKMIEGEFPRTACGVLFRTSLIKDNDIRFDEDMKYGEDMLFTIRILSGYKQNVGVFNESYYFVEHRDGSAMRTIDPERFNKILLLSQRLNEVFIKMGKTEYHNRSLNKYFFDDINTSIFNISKTKILFAEKINKINYIKKSEHTVKILDYFIKDKIINRYKIKAIYIKFAPSSLIYLYYIIKSVYNKFIN